MREVLSVHPVRTREREWQMRRILTGWMESWLVLALAAAVGAPALAAVAVKAANQADVPANTIPLNATSTVNDCITVEAVLLPRKPAGMLFGGYVADNFAVIKTTISNHCANQQFILHNIYFDYSEWALSGVYPNHCTPAASGAAAAPAAAEPAAAEPAKAAAAAGVPPAGAAAAAAVPGAAAAPDAGAAGANLCPIRAAADPYTMGSLPGQVATVGALDVQDQEVEDSVFSPRNKVVQALTLIGQVAQGYAFVGSAGAAQGIGAYNSAFVQNLSKLWPDRRLDQEKFLLSLGYRTDQSTAIAKDDHGSYYAFFPLATFPTPNLQKLFLTDSAVFLNPAEAWLESGALGTGPWTDKRSPRGKKDELAPLRDSLYNLAVAARDSVTPAADADKGAAGVPAAPAAGAGAGAGAGAAAAPAAAPVFDSAVLLAELAADCPGEMCPYSGNELNRVLAEKYLFAHASLNSVKIVARGIMTIDVNSVRPTIDKVAFDNEASGAALWTVPAAAAAAKPAAAAAGAPVAAAAAVPAAAAAVPAAAAAVPAAAVPAAAAAPPPAAAGPKAVTGEITGTYLSGGTVAITEFLAPNGDTDQTKYIAKGSLQAVSAKSTDASLAFTLNLAGTTMPSGTKLTFTVTRPAAAASSSSSGTAPAPLVSNAYVYPVTYAAPPANPTLTSVTVASDAKWQTPGKVDGSANGTNLSGGTLAVSTLEISGSPVTVSDYISGVAEIPKSSTAILIDFQLTLVKAIPPGAKITFVASTKPGDATLNSSPLVYTVPSATAAAKPVAKAGAKGKPVAKATATPAPVPAPAPAP